MFTEAEIEIIESQKGLFDQGSYLKASGRILKPIRERYDENERGIKECFCSKVRRKIWLKDFFEWYEANK